MQLGKRSCVALAAVALRTSGFPVVVEVRRPQPPGNSTLLTVTLCLHFTLTDNLWFTTVVKGGEAAVVSTGVRGERCHLMLQNAATICVKSQVCSWSGRLHIDRHVRDDVVCVWAGRRRGVSLSLALFTLPHHGVHLVQQSSGVAGGGWICVGVAVIVERRR